VVIGELGLTAKVMRDSLLPVRDAPPRRVDLPVPKKLTPKKYTSFHSFLFL
jgi:hypothetical protein